MKRSPQKTVGGVSFSTLTPTTTTTTTTPGMATLAVPPPFFHPHHPPHPQYHHHNGLTRSPTRSNPNSSDIADDLSDDLFGSAAWKKSRVKRSGKKGGGLGREGEERNSQMRNSKRWAFVQFMEQHAKKVQGRVRAFRKWCADVNEGLWVLRNASGSPKRAAFAAEGGRNGSAVPTANGTVPATATVRSKGSGSAQLTSEDTIQEAKLICGSYIYHRLSSKGLMSKRVRVAPHHSLVADELCAAGQEMERLYPRVFSDVSRRISMTMTSAQIVRRAVTSVLEDIFRSGVTWARVVAMVTIAAAFAEECVLQGHPSFVDDVVMCVGHFVALRLTDWLMKQGGWDAFPTSCPPETEKTSDESRSVLNSVLIIFLAAIFLVTFFTLCLGAT